MNIKIEIDDDRFFCDVAPVVDRKDFSNEIEHIRKKVGLNKILSLNEYPHFIEIFGVEKDKALDREVEKSRKRLFLPTVFKPVIEKAAVCGVIGVYPV